MLQCGESCARNPMKLNLPGVSLLCVDTRFPDLALFSMQRSKEHVRFGESVLVTRRGFQCSDPQIKLIEIPELKSTEAYSYWLLKELAGCFTCEHVLIVQWDSFVLNPNCWRDEFLYFDYIGAPWPKRSNPVGNGGFSLRSRRLVDTMSSLDLPVFHPEDEVICEHRRKELIEKFAVRFAPLELARQFSFELTLEHHPTFGFHGLFNFGRVLSKAELLAWFASAPKQVLLSMQARRLVKSLIADRRFEEALLLLDLRRQGSLWHWLDSLKLLLRMRCLQWLWLVFPKH